MSALLLTLALAAGDGWAPVPPQIVDTPIHGTVLPEWAPALTIAVLLALFGATAFISERRK